MKAFPDVFASHKEPETYLQHFHTTKIEHCRSTRKWQILPPQPRNLPPPPFLAWWYLWTSKKTLIGILSLCKRVYQRFFFFLLQSLLRPVLGPCTVVCEDFDFFQSSPVCGLCTVVCGNFKFFKVPLCLGSVLWCGGTFIKFSNFLCVWALCCSVGALLLKFQSSFVWVGGRL